MGPWSRSWSRSKRGKALHNSAVKLQNKNSNKTDNKKKVASWYEVPFHISDVCHLSKILFSLVPNPSLQPHACSSKNCKQATSVLSRKHLSTSSNQNMMVYIVDAYTENLQFGLFFYFGLQWVAEGDFHSDVRERYQSATSISWLYHDKRWPDM